MRDILADIRSFRYAGQLVGNIGYTEDEFREFLKDESLIAWHFFKYQYCECQVTFDYETKSKLYYMTSIQVMEEASDVKLAKPLPFDKLSNDKSEDFEYPPLQSWFIPDHNLDGV